MHEKTMTDRRAGWARRMRYVLPIAPAALAVLAGLSLAGTEGHRDRASPETMATRASPSLVQQSWKWLQPPEPTEPDNIYFGWNELSGCCFPMAADDWVCDSEDVIAAVHWWGSYIGWREPVPPPEPFDHFHIWIWSDVPAEPGGPGFSHPGVVLHEVYVDLADVATTFAGWDYDPRTETYEAAFRFDAQLDPAQYFEQVPGTVYWLGIGAGYRDGDHPWGWKTRPRDPQSPARDDAVVMPNPNMLCPIPGTTWEEIGGGAPLFWPTPEESWDLAFELTGRAVVQEQKWTQPPHPEWPGLHAHDYDLSGTYQTINLADQWQCPGGLATRLTWYGNYETDAAGAERRGSGIQQFLVTLHANAPGVPWCLPGIVLPVYGVPFPAAGETATGLLNNEGSMIYRYDFVLPERFDQVQGEIYWLDLIAISVNPADPPLWRWQEAGREPVPILCPAADQLGPVPMPWQSIVWPTMPPTFSDLAFEVASSFYGELTIKWSQPPEPYLPPDAFTGWGEPSVYGSEQIAADDWLCQTPAPVADVHWWGSFLGWHEPVPPPDILPQQFEITIWTDVPAGEDEPFSHPGLVIHRAACEGYDVDFVGWNFDPRDPARPPEPLFRFACDLDSAEWFFQEPGENVYWISIAARPVAGTEPEHPFGWKTRPRIESPAPDDAVRVFDPTAPAVGAAYGQGEPIFWPTPEESWDLAFALSTVETVACCLPDGSCQDLGWMMCVEMGGDPQGPGTLCANTDCWPLKWAQPPIFAPIPPSEECFYGWDELSHFACCQVAADDWPCADDRPVTDVAWWGSYLSWDFLDPPPFTPEFPMGFHLAVWTNVPAGMDEPFSHPGIVVHEWFVPREVLNERPVGCDWHESQPLLDTCFRYDFAIPWAEWFRQDPGATEPTIYWISIAAMYEMPPGQFEWGWKTRPHRFEDDAVRVFDPPAPHVGAAYLAGEPILDQWDMSFVITSRECIGDTNDDGQVDVDDLVNVILSWGPVPPGDPAADCNHDGTIDVDDLILVILHWGPCP